MSVELFHRDFGGAGRPPLVILHGLLGSSRNWQTAGPDLSARYHVLAPDLRNHGESPHAEPMTYEAMAEDVAVWLDAQGIAHASVLGHSMGGKVAMLLACREPQRVERLVVVDIAPKDYHWTSTREAFAAMNELEFSSLRSRAEAEQRLRARVPGREMRQFLLTNLGRMPDGAWKWQINLAAITAALAVLERNPLGPADRFDGPAHFILGGKSDYVQPGDYAAVTGHFPSARLEVIAAAGHNPHIERRQEFVRAVLGE